MQQILLIDQQELDSDNDQHEDTKADPGFQTQINPYVTSYVCLLAPRFEEHLLVGDLADQLHSWMNDICISFGWRLKFLDINPKYLHWIMAVSITEFPTRFIKTVRRESSKRIFEDFPKFGQRNMSNEFWAPWYFVGVGELPYSQEAIHNCMRQIRIEQGLK